MSSVEHSDPVESVASQRPARAIAEKKNGYWWGTGRRKTAVARVRIREGSGSIMVNGKEFKAYFCNEQDRLSSLGPLQASQNLSKYDVIVKIAGGGPTGQAGAMRLGIARALLEADPTTETILRAEGFMTRDSRMKERKKYGQRGARRRFQFSKR